MQNNNIHDGFGEYAVTHQVNINIALVACSLNFSCIPICIWHCYLALFSLAS